MMTNFFWFLWGFDALVALVVLYFFFTGLADGSVSSFNMTLWMGILLVVIGIPACSLWLKAQDHFTMAKTLLWIMALPALLYLLFMLIVLITKPRWN